MTLPKPWRCGGAARAPAAAATVALLALMSRAPLAAAAQEVSLDFEGLQPERHSMVEFPYRFRVSNPGALLQQHGGVVVLAMVDGWQFQVFMHFRGWGCSDNHSEVNGEDERAEGAPFSERRFYRCLHFLGASPDLDGDLYGDLHAHALDPGMRTVVLKLLHPSVINIEEALAQDATSHVFAMKYTSPELLGIDSEPRQMLVTNCAAVCPPLTPPLKDVRNLRARAAVVDDVQGGACEQGKGSRCRRCARRGV
eukprot:Tamp_27928.p1 GENE.Tamp_27928~~Tamp_27928.p1  ORF type:complete len:253 (+),score=31.88 Tamp_27928:50-808(+)